MPQFSFQFEIAQKQIVHRQTNMLIGLQVDCWDCSFVVSVGFAAILLGRYFGLLSKEASMFSSDVIGSQNDCLEFEPCAPDQQFLLWGKLFAMNYKLETPLTSAFPELVYEPCDFDVSKQQQLDMEFK